MNACRAQHGGSYQFLKFHCNHLPDYLKGRTRSGILIPKLLLRLLKWAACNLIYTRLHGAFSVFVFNREFI